MREAGFLLPRSTQIFTVWAAVQLLCHNLLIELRSGIYRQTRLQVSLCLTIMNDDSPG
jgi:hypothetical protein